MKIINRTRYGTRALRSIITACHDRFALTEGRLPTWRAASFVLTALDTDRPYDVRTWRQSGLPVAYIALPAQEVTIEALIKAVQLSLCRLADYRAAIKWTVDDVDFASTFGERLIAKPRPEPKPREPRPVVPRDLIAERRANAERTLEKWRKKLKTAARMVPKWERRVAYYVNWKPRPKTERRPKGAGRRRFDFKGGADAV